MSTVNRQAALDALNHELRCGAVINQCGLEVAYEVIEGLPSSEPEIIRCRDCRHRDEFGCCKQWTGLAIGKIPVATDDDDFCSYAEQRWR